MNEVGEVDSALVLARCETTEMLEAIEASLDPLALFVDFDVVQDDDLAIALGRDERLRLQLRDPLT